MLLFGSMWYGLLVVWNMGLLLHYPEFLEMPKWKRTVPFGAAVIFTTYWLVSMFAEVVKLF